jgi:hypothetical protein
MEFAQDNVLKLNGFLTLEEIHRNSHSVLTRALREIDNAQVILKTVPADSISPATNAQLHKEFQVAQVLQVS